MIDILLILFTILYVHPVIDNGQPSLTLFTTDHNYFFSGMPITFRVHQTHLQGKEIRLGLYDGRGMFVHSVNITLKTGNEFTDVMKLYDVMSGDYMVYAVSGNITSNIFKFHYE